MGKILDRYILREIALPFVLVLFILTFVLLMGRILQLMDLLVNKGVDFLDISKFVVLLMPSFLMFTIPMSLLVSILIGLGRMSGDNEITVMKASGISLYRMARPIAAAAAVAFVLTGVITLFLVPQSKYATKVHLYNVSKQKASIGIREKIFIDYFKGLLIYAESIPLDGAFMEGVLIADTRLTTEPSTIVAKRAYLISDPRALTITMRLESGSTHTVDPQYRNYRKMDFDIYDVNLDIGSALMAEGSLREKSTGEMNILELRKRLRQGDAEKRKLRDAAIELHKKLSIPVSCLILGLLAIPLGIRTNRAAKSWSISIGFGLTVLSCVLQLGGEALVQAGRIAPLIGTWVPNLAFGAAGILLFAMAARERSWKSLVPTGAAARQKREKGDDPS